MPTATLGALAAAGRILFAPIPDFKPVSAICIIAGAVFGKHSGFMVGALAALCSNLSLIHIFTGATGCGKTTLLRCCKPELAPNGTRTGSIKLFGQESSTLSVEESASTIGFVMQNPDNQLVCSEPWHELAFGLENLAVSQDAMRRRVAEIAHFFGMNSWLHQNVNDLSGGQKQLDVYKRQGWE